MDLVATKVLCRNSNQVTVRIVTTTQVFAIFIFVKLYLGVTEYIATKISHAVADYYRC